MNPPNLQSIYNKYFPALNRDNSDLFIQNILGHKKIIDKSFSKSKKQSETYIKYPPLPFFIDLEITTACQLRCKYCARTFGNVESQHMSLDLVQHIIDSNPNCISVNLVGLGEPLLHPELKQIISLFKEKNIRVAIVTNAMKLDKETSVMLLEAGLDAISFSLDSVDPNTLARQRQGADLPLIKRNIKQFIGLQESSNHKITTNIFCVIQPETISGLGDLARFASQSGIPALVVSDLNFEYNRDFSLRNYESSNQLMKDIYNQMKEIAKTGMVLLGPKILDTTLPARDWPEALIKKPQQITTTQAPLHRNCLAPWRTLVVRVDGNINFCNCIPETEIGNIWNQRLDEIWHHHSYQLFRSSLYNGTLSEQCKNCPRL